MANKEKQFPSFNCQLTARKGKCLLICGNFYTISEQSRYST